MSASRPDIASAPLAWIARLIAADPRAMAQLRAARELALPDWCIAAGFVRNRVWDALHGVAPRREPHDVDVLFFDPADAGRAREADAEAYLGLKMPGTAWEVRNQARMHVAKGLPPHRDTAHAMTFWLETPTIRSLSSPRSAWRISSASSVVRRHGAPRASRITPRGLPRSDGTCSGRGSGLRSPIPIPAPRPDRPAYQRVGTGFSPL